MPVNIGRRARLDGGRALTKIRLSDGDAIDVSSPVPYYYQLLKVIETNIRRREWKPGQKLPSEKALGAHFGVSRTVTRQALNLLAASGLIETHKGKGSYVAEPKNSLQQMGSLTSFYEDVAARGKRPYSVVLDLKVIPAYGEIAEYLQLAEGEPVILLHRLRFIDDQPALVSLTYLPERLCPGLIDEDFANQSLYRLLAAKYGLAVVEGNRTIESINAPSDLAELLRVPAGSALSLLKSIGYTADGTALEFFMSWHRGDLSQFQVRVVSNGA